MSAIAAWAARHARVVLVVSALLAVAAAVVATQLPTNAGTDTLVDADTESYRATQGVRDVFGEEPAVVLAEGDLPELVLTSNLARLLRLEGCLSGNVPRGAEPIPGPCSELAEMQPVQFVVGPATFLNEAVIQIDRQLRRLAATVPPISCANFCSGSLLATGSPAFPASPTPTSLLPSSSTCAARAEHQRLASPTSSQTTTRHRSSSACGPS